MNYFINTNHYHSNYKILYNSGRILLLQDRIVSFHTEFLCIYEKLASWSKRLEKNMLVADAACLAIMIELNLDLELL
jgi:hypothetical protein